VTKPVTTLREFQTPELEDVQHRRRQLFALLLLVFVGVAGGLVLLAVASDLLGRPLPFANIEVLRIGFVLLAVAFALYVREREKALSRVERALIEERVLSAALEGRVRELTSILRAGRAVASTLSLEDVLHLILASAQELLAATEGSVMLLDDDKKTLRIAASVGLSEEASTREILVGEGVAGWVAEFREAVILRGDVTDPRFRRFVPKDRQVRSAMSAPLYARAEPVGVLNVSVSEGDREYSEHDLRALTVFAEHAAIAINNARLYQRERAASVRLADLDSRRREFLAVVSHDLKAPLTAILGYSRLLGDLGPKATDEQTREFTAIIEKQAERMLQMIEQLLMATSVEQGAPVLAREPMDLEKLVREEITAFGGVLKDRPVEVRIADDVPVVYGDPSAVEHILANLLDNAVKYSEDGTSLEVTVTPVSDEVRITVSDLGPGIPQELLTNVFDRYQRGDEVPSAGGVGLGLFIVRSLTQGHGGRVWAENREGGGAAVTFTLPIRREGGRTPG
jgi:two-component system, OmpR family, sensor histidine kinase KdpD